MQFVRHISLIAAIFFGFYLLELAAGYLLFPMQDEVLDTFSAGKTIFGTEPRRAVYDRSQLTRKEKKIVLVGSSNVREGLRPEQLASFIPGVGVYNISVGASNIKQLGELAGLALSAVRPEDRSGLTIVMGVWYGSFVEDGRRWKSGKTDVDIEMLRYGLYRNNGGYLPEPIFNAQIMPYAMMAVRPFMLTSYAYYHGLSRHMGMLAANAKNFFVGTGFIQEATDTNTHVVTNAEKEIAIKFWEGYMGPPEEWGLGGFDNLYSIASQISSAGAKLVLLDMPLPSWHRGHSDYDRIYRTRLPSYLVRMSPLPGFSYVNMREGFNDDEFYDSAHPRPIMTRQWASRLAQLILPALEK